LAQVINTTDIKILNLSKNNLGDESIIMLADSLFDFEGCGMQKIDFSSCRVGDSGLIYLLDKSNASPDLV